ncbi:MAG: Asp-tRNA(Asn)/Glu-tRNA(Gln) amidotransferase subunit GatB [Myxococcales bacterium]|nr:Asp-tRNA(Asn)/Glu-tRNA(Gln) amidotransferase subunit GatB [Myxococcales bacterium]
MPLAQGAWEAVIGLEVHVQLATTHKLLSRVPVAFGADPNELTSPVVLGLPGALPVLNREAGLLAARLTLAVGGTLNQTSNFSRKQYFYPDLPKGYQITQWDLPICEGGAVEYFAGTEVASAQLARIHMEEDAGKSTHAGAHSLVDLNRAGVPLVEVVTTPCMSSAAQAAEFMRALHRLVVALGVCHGDLEKGQLRCDANVSIRRVGATALGTRTELKNINSFRFVERAIEHEIARQIALVEAGGVVTQETRLWDPDHAVSVPMRSKEEANDYRYMPDPDLPPLVLTNDEIAHLRVALPELPMATYRRYVAAGLASDDAKTLVAAPELAAYLDDACAAEQALAPKTLANWIVSELVGALGARGLLLADCPVTPPRLAALVALVHSEAISGKIGKDVVVAMFDDVREPAAIVEANGWSQIRDEAAIAAVAQRIVLANARQAEAYRAGNDKLIGFFVGQVLKEFGGRADPKIVQRLVREALLAGGAPGA